MLKDFMEKGHDLYAGLQLFRKNMCKRESKRGEADVTLECQLSVNPNKGSVGVDFSALATFRKVSQLSRKGKREKSGLNPGIPSPHHGD